MNMFNGYTQPLYESDPGRDGALKKPSQLSPWPYGQTFYNNPDSQQQAPVPTWQPKPAYPTMAPMPSKCACTQCQQGPWYHKEPEPVHPSLNNQEMRMSSSGSQDLRMLGPASQDLRMLSSGNQDMRMLGPGAQDVRTLGPGNQDVRLLSSGNQDMRMLGSGNQDLRMLGSGGQDMRLMSSSTGAGGGGEYSMEGYSRTDGYLRTGLQPKAFPSCSYPSSASENYTPRLPTMKQPTNSEFNNLNRNSEQYMRMFETPGYGRKPPEPRPKYWEGVNSAFYPSQQYQYPPSSCRYPPFNPPYYYQGSSTAPSYQRPQQQNGMQQYYGIVPNPMRQMDVCQQPTPPYLKPELNSNKISPLRLLRKKKITETMPSPPRSSQPSDSTQTLDVRRFLSTWADEDEDCSPVPQMVVLDCQDINPDQAELLRLYEESAIRIVQEPSVEPTPEVRAEVTQPKPVVEEMVKEPEPNQTTVDAISPTPAVPAPENETSVITNLKDTVFESNGTCSEKVPSVESSSSASPSPASPANSHDSLPVLADLPTSEYRKNKFLDYDEKSFPQLPVRLSVPDASVVPSRPESAPVISELSNQLQTKKSSRKRGRKPTIKFSIQKSHDLKISLRVMNENKNNSAEQVASPERVAQPDEVDSRDLITLRLEGATDNLQMGDLRAKRERKFKRRKVLEQTYSVSSEEHLSDATADGFQVQESVDSAKIKLTFKRRRGESEGVSKNSSREENGRKRKKRDRPAAGNEAVGAGNSDGEEPPSADTTTDPNGLPPDAARQPLDALGGPPSPLREEDSDALDPLRPDDPCEDSSPVPMLRLAEPIQHSPPSQWGPEPCALSHSNEPDSSHQCDDYHTIRTPRNSNTSSPKITSSCHISSPRTSTDSIERELQAIWNGDSQGSSKTSNPKEDEEPVTSNRHVVDFYTEEIPTGTLLDDSVQKLEPSFLENRNKSSSLREPSPSFPASVAGATKNDSPNHSPLRGILETRLQQTVEGKGVNRVGVICHGLNFVVGGEPADLLSSNEVISQLPNDNNALEKSSTPDPEHERPSTAVKPVNLQLPSSDHLTDEETLRSRYLKNDSHSDHSGNSFPSSVEMAGESSPLVNMPGYHCHPTEESRDGKVADAPRGYEKDNLISDSCAGIDSGTREGQTESQCEVLNLNSGNSAPVPLELNTFVVASDVEIMKSQEESGNFAQCSPESNTKLTDFVPETFNSLAKDSPKIAAVPAIESQHCRNDGLENSETKGMDAEVGASVYATPPSDENVNSHTHTAPRHMGGELRPSRGPRTPDEPFKDACSLEEERNESDVVNLHAFSSTSRTEDSHLESSLLGAEENLSFKGVSVSSQGSRLPSNDSSKNGFPPEGTDPLCQANHGICHDERKEERDNRKDFEVEDCETRSKNGNIESESKNNSISPEDTNKSSSQFEDGSKPYEDIADVDNCKEPIENSGDGPENSSSSCWNNHNFGLAKDGHFEVTPTEEGPRIGPRTPLGEPSCHSQWSSSLSYRSSSPETFETPLLWRGPHTPEEESESLTSGTFENALDSAAMVRGPQTPEEVLISSPSNSPAQAFRKEVGPNPEALQNIVSDSSTLPRNEDCLEEEKQKKQVMEVEVLEERSFSSVGERVAESNSSLSQTRREEVIDCLVSSPSKINKVEEEYQPSQDWHTLENRDSNFGRDAWKQGANNSLMGTTEQKDEWNQTAFDKTNCTAPHSNEKITAEEEKVDAALSIQEDHDCQQDMAKAFTVFKCISPVRSPVKIEQAVEEKNHICEAEYTEDERGVAEPVIDENGVDVSAEVGVEMLVDDSMELESDENANFIVNDDDDRFDLPDEGDFDASDNQDGLDSEEHVARVADVVEQSLTGGPPDENILVTDCVIFDSVEVADDAEGKDDGDKKEEVPPVDESVQDEELEDGEIVDDEDEYIVVTEGDIIVEETMLIELSDDEEIVDPVQVPVDLAVGDIPLPPGEAPKENCFDLKKWFGIKSRAVSDTLEKVTETVLDASDIAPVELCDSPFPSEELDLFRNPSPPGTPRMVMSPTLPVESGLEPAKPCDILPAFVEEEPPRVEVALDRCSPCPGSEVDGDAVPDDAQFQDVMENCLANAKRFLSREHGEDPKPTEQAEKGADMSSRDVLLSAFEIPSDLEIGCSASSGEGSLDFSPFQTALGPESLPVDNWPYLEEEVPLSPSWPAGEEDVPLDPPEPEIQVPKMDLLTIPLLPKYLCTDKSRAQLLVIYGGNTVEENRQIKARRSTLDTVSGGVMPRKKFASERQWTDSDAELDILKENALNHLKCCVSLERLDEGLQDKKRWWPQNVIKKEDQSLKRESVAMPKVRIETAAVEGSGSDRVYRSLNWQPKVVLSRLSRGLIEKVCKSRDDEAHIQDDTVSPLNHEPTCKKSKTNFCEKEFRPSTLHSNKGDKSRLSRHAQKSSNCKIRPKLSDKNEKLCSVEKSKSCEMSKVCCDTPSKLYKSGLSSKEESLVSNPAEADDDGKQSEGLASLRMEAEFESSKAKWVQQKSDQLDMNAQENENTESHCTVQEIVSSSSKKLEYKSISRTSRSYRESEIGVVHSPMSKTQPTHKFDAADSPKIISHHRLRKTSESINSASVTSEGSVSEHGRLRRKSESVVVSKKKANEKAEVSQGSGRTSQSHESPNKFSDYSGEASESFESLSKLSPVNRKTSENHESSRSSGKPSDSHESLRRSSLSKRKTSESHESPSKLSKKTSENHESSNKSSHVSVKSHKSPSSSNSSGKTSRNCESACTGGKIPEKHESPRKSSHDARRASDSQESLILSSHSSKMTSESHQVPRMLSHIRRLTSEIHESKSESSDKIQGSHKPRRKSSQSNGTASEINESPTESSYGLGEIAESHASPRKSTHGSGKTVLDHDPIRKSTYSRGKASEVHGSSRKSSHITRNTAESHESPIRSSNGCENTCESHASPTELTRSCSKSPRVHESASKSSYYKRKISESHASPYNVNQTSGESLENTSKSSDLEGRRSSHVTVKTTDNREAGGRRSSKENSDKSYREAKVKTEHSEALKTSQQSESLACTSVEGSKNTPVPQEIKAEQTSSSYGSHNVPKHSSKKTNDVGSPQHRRIARKKDGEPGLVRKKSDASDSGGDKNVTSRDESPDRSEEYSGGPQEDEGSDDAQPWVCGVCGFSDVQLQQKHIQEHSFHCQSCHLAFKTEAHFIKHLTRKHQDIRKMHHCLLCELSFDTDVAYQAHLLTREHAHLEAVEKSTIHTLFTLLSGQSCPVLGPVEPRPEWLPSQAGTVHFYHQATPLSLALQYWKMKQGSALPQ